MPLFCDNFQMTDDSSHIKGPQKWKFVVIFAKLNSRTTTNYSGVLNFVIHMPCPPTSALSIFFFFLVFAGHISVLERPAEWFWQNGRRADVGAAVEWNQSDPAWSMECHLPPQLRTKPLFRPRQTYLQENSQ